LLLVQSQHPHYDYYDEEYELNDLDDFSISGEGEQQEYPYYLTSPSNPQLTSSYAGGGKKGSLSSLRLPMLLTEAPVQTKKTLELPAELHTTKTIQPIIRSRTIYQPIIQQRMIEQPILRTHLLIQPVHK
jgi:hypothetical protein